VLGVVLLLLQMRKYEFENTQKVTRVTNSKNNNFFNFGNDLIFFP